MKLEILNKKNVERWSGGNGEVGRIINEIECRIERIRNEKEKYDEVWKELGKMNIEIVGKIEESELMNDEMNKVGDGIGDNRENIYEGIGIEIIGDKKRSKGKCWRKDKNREN